MNDLDDSVACDQIRDELDSVNHCAVHLTITDGSLA